jgi:hypothetical protein
VLSNLPTNPLDEETMKPLVTRSLREISTIHERDDAESTATSPKVFPIPKLTIQQWASRLPKQLSAKVGLHNLPGSPEEATKPPHANRYIPVRQPDSTRPATDKDEHILALIEVYTQRNNELSLLIQNLDREAKEIHEKQEQARQEKKEYEDFIKNLLYMKTRNGSTTIDGVSAYGAPSVRRTGSVVEDSKGSSSSPVIQ